MKKRYTSPYLTFGTAALLLTLMGTLLFIKQELHPIIAYLLGVNLTTFLLYGYDKQISRGDGLRVPEKILHLLALLGGSPAGLFAQKFFHHKTLKGSFQLIYWLTVLLQLGILYWLNDSNLLSASIKSVGNIA